MRRYRHQSLYRPSFLKGFVLVCRKVVKGERKAHSQTGSKSGPDSYVGPDQPSLGAPVGGVKVKTRLVWGLRSLENTDNRVGGTFPSLCSQPECYKKYLLRKVPVAAYRWHSAPRAMRTLRIVPSVTYRDSVNCRLLLNSEGRLRLPRSEGTRGHMPTW